MQWPAEVAARDALTICVVGEDPFGDAWKLLDGRRVRGKPLVVRRTPEPAGLAKCHILFAGAAEADDALQQLRGVKGEPVLTVGQSPGFAERGGMVNFTVAAGKVRVEVNPEVTGAAKLKMSARLLKLATLVGKES